MLRYFVAWIVMILLYSVAAGWFFSTVNAPIWLNILCGVAAGAFITIGLMTHYMDRH